MYAVVKVGIALLKILYGIMKTLPTKKNKVLFLCRRSDNLTLDFRLLKEAILKQDAQVKIASVCVYYETNKKSRVSFGVALLKSMIHMATSSVCVIDAYWPTVSVLNHKKDLKIIQMWHASGKIKQSGYQTIGKAAGRSKIVSELLCMHRNYDHVIAGGKAWNMYYSKSFGVEEDKLVNIGLPRMDYIIHSETDNKKTVLEKYPELDNKIVILYAPTFRKNIELRWESILEHIDFDKCALILKGHPHQKISSLHPKVMNCPEFETVDLLSVCDYLITDYSSVAIEGAILNKKTYYYLYDYEEYIEKNGLNVDPFDAMPGCAFKDGKALMRDLMSGNYKQESLDHFREKYLPDDLGESANKLASLVYSYLCQ